MNLGLMLPSLGGGGVNQKCTEYRHDFLPLGSADSDTNRTNVDPSSREIYNFLPSLCKTVPRDTFESSDSNDDFGSNQSVAL
jgi:hypothetical protein